jgi:hypothetical protein
MLFSGDWITTICCTILKVAESDCFTGFNELSLRQLTEHQYVYWMEPYVLGLLAP